MSPKKQKDIAILLLALLALPTGLCSLYFTPLGFASMSSHDGLERFVGTVALLCSAVGWLICGVSIWGAVRLRRAADAATRSGDPAP
jgi:hypothetical protein